MRTYDYHHVISFEETNLVGNVYYVNHLRWQGRCREMFLRDLAPDILQALQRDLILVTVRCSCEYLSELFAFDQVIVRMHLGALTQSRVTLMFEYWREKDQHEELIAHGEQQVACMQREGEQIKAIPVPPSLREALRPYEA